MNKILEGTIKVTGKGAGYFTNPADATNDFEVQPENIGTALNNDTVKVEVLEHEVYGRKQAKVTEIISRKRTTFVGMFDGAFVIPDDKKMYRAISIDSANKLGAKDGDKVQPNLSTAQAK